MILAQCVSLLSNIGMEAISTQLSSALKPRTITRDSLWLREIQSEYFRILHFTVIPENYTSKLVIAL